MSDSKTPSSFPKVSDRYDIESPLGQGGMGVVYKAYDKVTKRFVAVKTLWGDIEPGAIELFEREWTVLARLSHPNIVDILDTGEFRENGQRKPYFVMPLLPGKTLDLIIKHESQRLSVERVVEIMCQACKGLQAAHDQNLVHRDLKPSNIFVMDDDSAKIIDFGVAHLADSRSITGIKGTLQYMAPEQIDMSSPISARSDIFSLAIVCYEALTGRKPFARRTEADTIEAIRTDIPPPASEINNTVNNLVSRTVHKAMAKQPWHRFSSAKEFSDTLQRALRNEPIERFDRAKIQPRIERVRKAFTEGDNQFAMEILTELESEGHIDPEMPVLRGQIEQSVRQRNIRQLLDSARTRMEGEEHPLALQKIGEVLAIDPSNADALALRSQIERQRSDKQMEGWFRLVEEHRENQLFTQAKQGLQEILKIDSSNTHARSMLSQIEQSEQELTKFREEKQRLYQGALASYQNGEISSALSKLERGLDLSRRPNAKTLTTELDAQYQSFYNQVRSERDAAKNAYAEGRKNLEDKNTARTLEICEEFLQKHPNDPMFQALKLEAEEGQRQEQSAAIAEVEKRAEQEPDLDKKFNILQDACERFPNEPHFKQSLKLIRDRRDLVNSIVARARQYEERSQFAEAANQWDILRNIYPVYPGLEFEVDRLARRREEHAKAETKAHWMERIDAHFAAGEYARARDVIREALAEFPNDKELEGLESLAEQGIRRSGEAHVLLEQGQQLCGAKNYEDGLDALRKAERLDPRNAATRATLLSCLVDHARELISKDWHTAEPLIQEASALNAEDPVVRSLNSLLESQKRQESINNILVEARGLQAADDLAGALKKVEQGLAEYPNEVRLAQLHNTLRAAVAVARADSSAQATSFAATSFQPLTPAEEKLVVPPPPPPPLPPWKPAPLKQAPPQPPPLPNAPRKPAWLIPAIAGGALLILAAILYPLLHKSPVVGGEVIPAVSTQVTVNLTANEAGARFKVDGAPVANSVSLKPGEHSGEADLDGFSPDIHSFTIKSNAAAPVNVAFTLHPALPQLLFNSGITNGTLILDDTEPAPLQEGAFNKTDIAMGDHRVRVMDGKREVFAFSFHAEPRQMIQLTSPLSNREDSGVVVSSLAGAARVYATPGVKGGISGQPMQPIPDGGLAVAAANPPQRVSFTDDKGQARELTPDSSAFPVLTVILAGGVQRVPITVTSNVPDALISLNGKAFNRKMVNGSRSFSLGAGTFNVTVTADGYQAAAPQQLIVKAGDALKHLDFQLTPEVHMASLNLSGGPPDAAVFLDELRAGTINTAGTFSKDVSPGVHVLAVRKAGLEEFKESHEFKAGDTVKVAVQMNAVAAGIALRVSPADAKIIMRRGTEIYTPANGQTVQLPPGSYVVTATADGFKTRTETVPVEAGHAGTIDWALESAASKVQISGAVPFQNAKSWTKDNGWMVHNGGGISVYSGRLGTHVIDILKRRNKFGLGTKRTVFVADFSDKGNFTQYGLDGHTLYKTVFVDGKGLPETHMTFGQENGDIIRMSVELAQDSFTIENREGKVIDSIHKSNIGHFAFMNDVTLNITP